MKIIAKYLKEFEIELFVAAVTTLWLIGAYGFIYALGKSGSIHDIADGLYLSLQLFIVTSGANDIKNYSWSLEFARWAAPLCLATATIRTVLLLAKENTNRLRLRFIANHDVVCGVGQKGASLVTDLLRHRKQGKIVVIEINPANPSLSEFRQNGVIVIVGDATDPAILIKAKVHRASTLIALTTEDKSNLQIAQIAYEIKHPHENTKSVGELANQLVCLIHLYDANLRRIFYSQFLFAKSHRNFEARLFSFYEKGARRLLQEHFSAHQLSVASDKDNLKQHNLFLVGFGWLGKSLAIQAARIGCYPDGRRLRVTVLDKRAEFLAQKLYQDIPAINQLLDICFYPVDVELLPTTLDKLHSLPCYTPGSLDLNVAITKPASTPVDIAFFGLGDELLNYTVARDLATWFVDCGTPPEFIVCLTDKLGLARLIDESTSRVGKVLIRPYELLEETCTFHSIVNPQLEILARTIHYDYVRGELTKLNEEVILEKCKALGKDGRKIWNQLQLLLKDFENISTIPSAIGKNLELFCELTGNSSVASWSRLPQELKDANREQAEHVAIKLKLIDCEIISMSNQEASSYRMSEKEVDMLARVEHTRWMAEKILQGWKYGVVKDSLHKTHPLLVPYDAIDQAEKDKDINTVHNIPKLLALQKKNISKCKTNTEMEA